MAKNKSPKRGRPSADLAGDVQARILDAAQQLFLEKGFRSASIDEISELAPASKPTIYAHFPGKEALFAAVVALKSDTAAEKSKDQLSRDFPGRSIFDFCNS